MRSIILVLAITFFASASALAQDAQYNQSDESGRVMVPVAVGTILRGPIQLETGEVILGAVQAAGQSPDDLFSYWVGEFDGRYYGYDVYAEAWRPGPVTYTKANLIFQEELVEGWVRNFAGLPDRDYFFGLDGMVYQRFNYAPLGQVLYTYFVNTVTYQRSDSMLLLQQMVQDPGQVNAIFEEQARQQEQFIAQINRRGAPYSYWQMTAHALPAQLPTVVSWTKPDLQFSAPLPQGQPSLLELIEDEVGPIGPDPNDADTADDDSGEAEPGSSDEG